MKFSTDRDFIQYLKTEDDYEELVATYFDNHGDLLLGREGATLSLKEWDALERVNKGLKLIIKAHLPKDVTPQTMLVWYKKVAPVIQELDSGADNSYADYQLLCGHLAETDDSGNPLISRKPGSVAYFVMQCMQKTILSKQKRLPDYEAFKEQYNLLYTLEKNYPSLNGALNLAYQREKERPGIYEELLESKKDDLKKLKRPSIMHTTAEQAEATKPGVVPQVQTSAHADTDDGTNRFWTDWGTGKKILYVILNLYTFCIPLILHFVLKFVKKTLGKA